MLDHQTLWVLFYVSNVVGFVYGSVEVYRYWKWSRGPAKVTGQWGLRVLRTTVMRREKRPILYIWGLVYLIAAIVLTVVSILLTPKPKQPKPAALKDLDDPVAQAGMPIPVVWGSVTVKGLNTLWFGDKRKIQYKVTV